MLTRPIHNFANQLYHCAGASPSIVGKGTIKTTNNLRQAIVFALEQKLRVCKNIKGSLSLDGNYIVVHNAGNLDEVNLRALMVHGVNEYILRFDMEENVGAVIQRDSKHFHCFDMAVSVKSLYRLVSENEIQRLFKAMKFLFLDSTLPKKVPVIVQ